MTESLQVSFSKAGEATLKLIREVVVEGLSAADMVKRLHAAGVDTYIAESGSLAIRYWQVVIDDFVAPGSAQELNVDPPADSSALNWVTSHIAELRQKYGGRWIAVENDEVVAAAASVAELVAAIPAATARPFITFVTVDPGTWNFVFGG